LAFWAGARGLAVDRWHPDFPIGILLLVRFMALKTNTLPITVHFPANARE
jgi:hypothetical protein